MRAFGAAAILDKGWYDRGAYTAYLVGRIRRDLGCGLFDCNSLYHGSPRGDGVDLNRVRPALPVTRFLETPGVRKARLAAEKAEREGQRTPKQLADAEKREGLRYARRQLLADAEEALRKSAAEQKRRDEEWDREQRRIDAEQMVRERQEGERRRREWQAGEDRYWREVQELAAKRRADALATGIAFARVVTAGLGDLPDVAPASQSDIDWINAKMRELGFER